MTLRRKLLRFAPPALLVLAIASYGALLYAAHVAAQRGDAQLRYAQLFGSDAFKQSGAIADPDRGALAIGGTATSKSSATWHFDSLDASVPQGTIVRSAEVFVTGLNLALYGPSSYARITLDEKQVGLLKPLLSNEAVGVPLAVANAPVDTIDIPPGVEEGFRFKVPPSSRCYSSGCTLRIDVKRATWIVRRVGLLLSTRAASATLWQPSATASILICFGAAVLAALSHLVLSLRLGRVSRASDAEWKAS